MLVLPDVLKSTITFYLPWDSQVVWKDQPSEKPPADHTHQQFD